MLSLVSMPGSGQSSSLFPEQNNQASDVSLVASCGADPDRDRGSLADATGGQVSAHVGRPGRRLRRDPALLLDEAMAAAKIPRGVPVGGLRGQPPVSNTGGKSGQGGAFRPSLSSLFHRPVLISDSESSQVWRAWDFSSRRWRDVVYPKSASFIDTLTVTFHESKISRVLPGSFVSDEDLCSAVGDILSPLLLGFRVGSKLPSRNFYARTFALQWFGEHDTVDCGFVAAGGNNDTVCIHLTGVGCGQLGRRDWVALWGLLLALDARITRADVAIDDYEGSRSVDWVASQFRIGGFNPLRGAPPRCRVFGDWVTGEGDPRGRTFQVGGRNSDKLHRSYEKGRELGDPESPWVRHETEYHAGDRVIPLAVIMRPGDFLAGAYAAMSWVSEVRVSIPVLKAKLRIAYSVMVRCARVSYGRLIWAMLGVEGSHARVLDILTEGVEDVPRRLIVPC